MARTASRQTDDHARLFVVLAALGLGTVTVPAAKAEGPAEETGEVARLAKASGDHRGLTRREPSLAPGAHADGTPETALDHPIVRAKRLVAESQKRYRQIQDYTCTFYKRERINGRLTPQYVMAMKARTQPASFYFKFLRPYAGREAIYVAGRHDGKVIVHDVGFNKLLAGTLYLDPRSSRAMEDNRHPITEAGLGRLLDTVAYHWERELDPAGSDVVIRTDLRIGNRPCTVIESGHPHKRPDYLFHLVRLALDQEHGMPVRFESYDWPKHPNQIPELVEEYSYVNLKFNVGLTDRDFDPANSQYSFGRF